MNKTRAPLGLATCALALLSACEPTQVLITFDAEEATRARAAAIQVRIEGQDDQEQQLGPFRIESGGVQLPTTVPVSPAGGDASRVFRIVGELLEERADGSLHVFSRQSARLHFAPDRLVRVELVFGDACRDLLCPEEFTCRNGLCVPDARCSPGDASTCPDGHRCVDGVCVSPTCAPGTKFQADTDRCEPICGGDAGCAEDEHCSALSARCEPLATANCGVPAAAPPACRASCTAPEQCAKAYQATYYCARPCDPCAPECWPDFRCVELNEGRSYCVARVRGEGERCFAADPPCIAGFACFDGRCTRLCDPFGPGQEIGMASAECAPGTLCFGYYSEIIGVCHAPRSPVETGQPKIYDCVAPQQILQQAARSYCTIPCPHGDADCPGDLYCATPARALDAREDFICVQPGYALEGVGCRSDDDCIAGTFCDAAMKECAARTH